MNTVERDPYDFSISDLNNNLIEIIEKNNKIRHFVLYETFNDLSSEYQMSKIRLNENEAKTISKILDDSNKLLKTIGCIGNTEQLLNFISNMFEPKDSINNFAEIKLSFETLEEGIMCILYNDLLIFAYKNKKDIFKVGPIDSGLSAIDYTR